MGRSRDVDIGGGHNMHSMKRHDKVRIVNWCYHYVQ